MSLFIFDDFSVAIPMMSFSCKNDKSGSGGGGGGEGKKGRNANFIRSDAEPDRLYCLYWSCLVPLRLSPRPSRSIRFDDLSKANGREKPRQE